MYIPVYTADRLHTHHKLSVHTKSTVNEPRLQSAVTTMDIAGCDAFHYQVWYHTLSLHYAKFGHHLHPPGYLCAKFCFFCDLHC